MTHQAYMGDPGFGDMAAERASLAKVDQAHGAWCDAEDRRRAAEIEARTCHEVYKAERARHHREFGEDE